MKKISAIFLLLLFLFSTTGYYVFYSIQLHKAKKEAKKQVLAGVPDSMLETIEASSNIRWEGDDDDEFLFEGNMYDVVRVEVKDGKTLYHCINDKKEKELLQKLARAIRLAHHPTQGKSGKQLIMLQLAGPADYTLPQPGWGIYTGRRSYFNYSTQLISSYKEIVTPPPRA